MATVDGITVAKAEAIEAKTIKSATITGGNLIITLVDDTTINAGPVGDLAAHAGDNTGVHGVGVVVGTTETQTLSGKTLTTPTIGSFVNAPHTHVDAAQGGRAWPFSGFRGTRTTSQTISDTTSEVVNFLVAAEYDTDSYRTSSTTFTMPATGWYDILTQIPWAGNNTGRRSVEIRLNDSTNDASGGTSIAKSNPAPGHGIAFSMQVGLTKKFNAGDYIKVYAFQASGGPLDIAATTTEFSTFLSITRIG